MSAAPPIASPPKAAKLPPATPKVGGTLLSTPSTGTVATRGIASGLKPPSSPRGGPQIASPRPDYSVSASPRLADLQSWWAEPAIEHKMTPNPDTPYAANKLGSGLPTPPSGLRTPTSTAASGGGGATPRLMSGTVSPRVPLVFLSNEAGSPKDMDMDEKQELQHLRVHVGDLTGSLQRAREQNKMLSTALEQLRRKEQDTSEPSPAQLIKDRLTIVNLGKDHEQLKDKLNTEQQMAAQLRAQVDELEQTLEYMRDNERTLIKNELEIRSVNEKLRRELNVQSVQLDQIKTDLLTAQEQVTEFASQRDEQQRQLDTLVTSSTNNVTNIASLYAQLTNLPRGGSLHRGTGPSAVHGAGKNLFEGSTESAQLARVETLRTQIAELDALCNAAGDDKFISGYLVEKRTHLSLLERRR